MPVPQTPPPSPRRRLINGAQIPPNAINTIHNNGYIINRPPPLRYPLAPNALPVNQRTPEEQTHHYINKAMVCIREAMHNFPAISQEDRDRCIETMNAACEVYAAIRRQRIQNLLNVRDLVAPPNE